MMMGDDDDDDSARFLNFFFKIDFRKMWEMSVCRQDIPWDFKTVFCEKQATYVRFHFVALRALQDVY